MIRAEENKTIGIQRISHPNLAARRAAATWFEAEPFNPTSVAYATGAIPWRAVVPDYVTPGGTNWVRAPSLRPLRAPSASRIASYKSRLAARDAD